MVEGRRKLRLLSLDNGVVRGLSQLLILGEIIEGIKDIKIRRGDIITNELLPCDYFDIIGGSGTGGVIAIMLGRLRMPVSEAIEKYLLLAEQAFSDKKDILHGTLFKATKFEKGFRAIFLGAGTLMRNNDGSRHSMVCAQNSTNRLRGPSYMLCSCPEDMGLQRTKIWEAARATIAVPDVFKPIEIGGNVVIAGESNPIEIINNKVQRIQTSQVSCVVSIGSGYPCCEGKVFGSTSKNQHVLKLKQLMRSIWNESHDIAEAARNDWTDEEYFRFDLGERLAGVSNDEWQLPVKGQVEEKARDYVTKDSCISYKISMAARLLS